MKILLSRIAARNIKFKKFTLSFKTRGEYNIIARRVTLSRQIFANVSIYPLIALQHIYIYIATAQHRSIENNNRDRCVPRRSEPSTLLLYIYPTQWERSIEAGGHKLDIHRKSHRPTRAYQHSSGQHQRNGGEFNFPQNARSHKYASL